MTSLQFLVVTSRREEFDRFAASAVSTPGLDVNCIKVEPASLAATVNTAVAASNSDWVSVVTARGVLAAGGVEALAGFIAEHPEAALIYSDETARMGRHGVAVLKPIFSPERLRCQFYLGEVAVYSRQAISELGGLDASLPGAELYDLALRAARSGKSIEHLDSAVFVRDGEQPMHLDAAALVSTERTLQTHLAATGGGTVHSVGADGVHDTRRDVVGEPLVSIVIPSRGIHSVIDGRSRCYLLEGVRGIVESSTYSHFELVVVLDTVAEPEVVTELTRIAGDRLRIVWWDRPFNFSDKINVGALASSGEFILLLNDDVEIITPDWLESLIALGQRPNAGMVGAMLYYEDETIQHAGHGYFEGDASHIGLDAPRGDAGPLQGYRVEREVSGVTAACALMPTAVFHEVGGLTNLLPGNFNDVDLCMKTTWLGYDIYFTPHAELYHFESKTRDASVHNFEVDVAWGRWGFRMHDPRYWPYPHNRTPV